LVLAHQRGQVEVEQVWPKPIDVKAIRQRVKMSQAEFARAYGISKRTLQEWEQGGRQPDSAARAYLTVIAKEPAVVRRRWPANEQAAQLERAGSHASIGDERPGNHARNARVRGDQDSRGPGCRYARPRREGAGNP
jgi:putative transcriptional regulator